MAVNDRPRTVDDTGNFEHPLYDVLLRTPGLSVATAHVNQLLTWGLKNSLWMFPMATSCCGIEFMAAAGSRVDLDRMGTIVRASPRQADVMVVAGTITTKMAPRVKKLWEQMPEPKWCIAMGSCAISGDFYRNLYSVVPGVDTFIPVDVYVPGCPPNPEALMQGLLRLQEKIADSRLGKNVVPELRPETFRATKPSLPRVNDVGRNPALTAQQTQNAFDATALGMREPLVIEGPPLPEVPAQSAARDFTALLRDEFGVAELPRNGPVMVPVSRHVELAQKLKSMGYRQLVTVVASHWLAGVGRKGKEPAETEHFEVSFALRSVGAGSQVVSWTVRLAPGEAIPTLAGVFAGCDWQEREQYDLLGVRFAGHPDLRRLMMAENYQGHPLRRDFPIDAPDAPWR
jgi:NADH-quinone oxidoreductase subunit B/C/D